VLPSRAGAIASTCTIVLFGLGCAELGSIDLSGLPGVLDVPLSEATAASGLKEALRVGTERAASTLSADGGFSNDPLLRLALPGELDTLARSLRAVGLGGQVDALELSMNRAAERAAGEAIPVFASAIGAMTVPDAFDILNGESDAAPRYFEARTSEQLRARFSPVVQNAMEEVGVYRYLRNALTQYEALPFAKPAAPDIETHVTDRALAGLFTKLAEEEGRIREDPQARTTELLRRTFGRPAAGG
jgi:hypothetical protein